MSPEHEYVEDDWMDVLFRIGVFPTLPWILLQRDEEISGSGDIYWIEPVYWGQFWSLEGLPWMIEVRPYGSEFHVRVLTLKSQCWGRRSRRELVGMLGGDGWRLVEAPVVSAALSRWALMRRDDNGNEFVVSRHADADVARAEVEIWSRGGHKQDYWAEERHLLSVDHE